MADKDAIQEQAPAGLSRVERYLAHLDRISGGIEPLFYRENSTTPGLPGVTSIVYRNLPDDLLTTLTYGLSLAEHPNWRHGTPELCLSVRSEDMLWARAAGYITERQRGRCPFSYGDVIDFGERISEESAMTAFFVFAPAVLEKKDYLEIDVSPPGHAGHDLIHIQGLYPIHEVERQYILEHGVGGFFTLDWDMYDVRRTPAV